MATFEAKVYRLKIEPHPNADKLELAAIGDYRAVVGKGLYKTGQLGVYVQEGSVVPEWLCKKYDWKLAGPQANRVKAIKLRGILSQGIVIPVRDGTDFDGEHYYSDGCDGHIELENGKETDICLGEDVAELLGITKYEPPIPVHMAGEVFNAHGYTLHYDIENIKKYPDVLSCHIGSAHAEDIIITEKLHGTWTCFGYHPDFEHPIVSSKGISNQGLAFKFNVANQNNLYIRSLVNTADGEGNDAIDRVQKFIPGPFFIVGETYGQGVQDLNYGLTKPHFRAFDIYEGEVGNGRYLPGDEFLDLCEKAQIETVPVLYVGPYDRAKIDELTNGQDAINGVNIREGVVVRGYHREIWDDAIGRVILKSVSEAYLLRKHKNATEYQ